MDDDNNDTADDPGRRESEWVFYRNIFCVQYTDADSRIRLRNAMSSKYLDEVIGQAEADYNDAVKMIGREKDNMYVSHLNAAK